MKTLISAFLFLVSTTIYASNFKILQLPKSQNLAEPPNITIALPASYEADTTKTYPVIYLLDGDLNGELVNGMSNRLYLSNGAHEHIIVGITSHDRIGDFAPTINKDPRGPVGAGGGGDKFLDFLEKELIPQVNKAYRTNSFNVLAGHSIAGLLVIHSFQSRPKLFQGHLAFSPAVWWGARETAKATQKYVTSKQPIKNYLYMNIGSEGGEMRAVYDSLSQTILRNRNLDLDLRLDEFNDDAHDFTMAAGLFNALTGLYQYQQKQGL
ncbi:alpha/beta hydrolase [Pseudoalteromonas umbrosa]|uniref:alpha/beta hydrolase n=1 Tax=Pseudoalteromonas umbrosa TaxID=3048489 RepID=UPI0024C39BF8|nr:alpha/beta hydrolase-fold protein [Pseudoalteromonas sp. B95]MDK1287697.1 alpha/beta hydrolase-fold protein [Pseudoalteromonas sp. B95]